MGIAVLLGDGDGDRYAVLHAIALAQRTGEVIHGIHRQPPAPPVPPPASTTEFGLALLLRQAGVAKVPVRCHALTGDSVKELLALVRTERIFCLIVGAVDEAEGKRVERRLSTLRREIKGDRHWSMRSFWAVVTGPWSEEAMAAAHNVTTD